jgi:hypothetical protein
MRIVFVLSGEIGGVLTELLPNQDTRVIKGYRVKINRRSVRTDKNTLAKLLSNAISKPPKA